MADTTEITARATSEHRRAPRFMAVLDAVAQPFAECASAMRELPADMDLDTATGDQLDVVGEWVGVSRVVNVALTGVYFTWDDTAADGWEIGVWQGPNDPTTGPVRVDDGAFRTLIRAKIAANNWDGTYESMCAFFDYAFGPGVVRPQDNQDMSITLLYDDQQMTAVTVALLLGGTLQLKPMGVRLIFQAATGAPIFAWDMTTPRYQGWTGTTVWT